MILWSIPPCSYIVVTLYLFITNKNYNLCLYFFNPFIILLIKFSTILYGHGDVDMLLLLYLNKKIFIKFIYLFLFIIFE